MGITYIIIIYLLLPTCPCAVCSENLDSKEKSRCSSQNHLLRSAYPVSLEELCGQETANLPEAGSHHLAGSLEREKLQSGLQDHAAG